MTYLLLPAMAFSASRAILTGMCAVIVHVTVEFDDDVRLVEMDLTGSEREELPRMDWTGQREKR
jgi:hypothetical protein